MTTAALSPLEIDVNQTRIYVDGKWRPSHSSERVRSINPTTEEDLGWAPDADAEDVGEAVRAARSALHDSDWAATTPAERASYVRKMADRLEERSSEMGTFLTSENGMSISATGFMNGNFSAEILRYYASLGEELQVEEERGTTVVRQEPIGVAGLIVPWNAPIMLSITKLAPALIAGCTAILKPAGETPLSAAFIIDAAEHAGLPDGVFNVVTGGRGTGAKLVEHPDVDKIAFTGSSAAGRSIAATCGSLMKACSLELGGSSAGIVLDDAAIDVLQQFLPLFSMGGNGQGCVQVRRLLVSRPRYEEVIEAFSAAVPQLPIGDPMDPEVVVGPLAMERQRDRVEGYIQAGLQAGARLLVGGKRPAHLKKGFYIEPTLFADVDNRSRIAREEIFGPVLTITPFDDDDEAVRLANDSDYGLAGAVFTSDVNRGINVARKVQTGTFGVNGYHTPVEAPFGGCKMSGIGRELGPEGLAGYLKPKSIYFGAAGK